MILLTTLQYLKIISWWTMLKRQQNVYSIKYAQLTHLPVMLHISVSESVLVQVMDCRLFGAKPFSKLMLVYCQLDSWEQISVKFESEYYHFHSRKCIWNCRLPKWRPFCPGGDELRFLVDSCDAFTHIPQGWFTSTGTIIYMKWPQKMWVQSNGF